MEKKNFFLEKLNQSNWGFYFFISIILILGIVLRTIALGYRGEFEDDETRLLLAIGNKNLWQMFLPLDFAQSAPPIFLVGLNILNKLSNGKEFVLKIFPYLFSIASIFKIYPILNRVSLYFVPFIILFIAKSLDTTKSKKFIPVLILFLIGFSGYANKEFFSYIIKSESYIDYYPLTLINEIKEKYNNETDIVLFNEASQANFLYYYKREKFYPVNYQILPYRQDDMEVLTRYLDSLPSNHRYWIYLAKDFSSNEIFPTLEKYLETQDVIFKSQYSNSRLILFEK